jgi:transcriptional antiterminator Rof (Rho-off)
VRIAYEINIACYHHLSDLSNVLRTGPRTQSARHGVIITMQAIDNRGDDETQTTKNKRSIGGMLGKIGGSLFAIHGGEAGHLVGGGAADAGQQVGGNLAAKVGDQGPAAHYMVKLRLNDGKILPTVQKGRDIQGLHEGSKVRVEGSGDIIRLNAE